MYGWLTQPLATHPREAVQALERYRTVCMKPSWAPAGKTAIGSSSGATRDITCSSSKCRKRVPCAACW